MKPKQCVLSHSLFCSLNQEISQYAIHTIHVYMYAETITSVRNCNRITQAIMMFLKVNFHIRTLHCNISVRRARRRKMKTFLLYNSDPNYQLRLFRIRSVQSLLRFNNHECTQLAGSHLNTIRSRDVIHMV